MSGSDLVDHAFDDLAHSLRVLLEADYRANAGGLLFVDRAEAVGNIENALTAVLNSFHSLYDAIEKQLGEQPVDWYQNGPLTLVLAIRNARHHNKANKIRTLYTFHAREAERPERMEQYVLIDFPASEEDADTFDVYMSWSDLENLLAMPRGESRLSEKTCIAIREYLRSDKFDGYARHYGLGKRRVFFNVVPLFVNAAAAIVPHIKPHLRGLSSESKFFAYHLSTVEPANTATPEVNCGPFVLPE